VPVLILPCAPQRLVVVGKIKGEYCPGKEIQVEYSRECDTLGVGT